MGSQHSGPFDSSWRAAQHSKISRATKTCVCLILAMSLSYKLGIMGHPCSAGLHLPPDPLASLQVAAGPQETPPCSPHLTKGNTAHHGFDSVQTSSALSWHAIWAKMLSFKMDDPPASNCLDRAFIQHAWFLPAQTLEIGQTVSTCPIWCLPTLTPTPIRSLPRQMWNYTHYFTIPNTAGASRYLQHHTNKSPNEELK